MEKNLKPCPFCGCENVELVEGEEQESAGVFNFPDEYLTVEVRCHRCPAEIKGREYFSPGGLKPSEIYQNLKDWAIDTWNKRTETK